MFNSPFQADQNIEPQFSFNGGQVPIQPQTQQAPTQQQAIPQETAKVQYSAEDINTMVANLKVNMMSNPVKIVEPSYVVTETQLKQLLGLKDIVQPQQVQPQYIQPQQQVQPQYIQPQYVQPQYIQPQYVQPQQLPQSTKNFKQQFSEALQAPPPTSNNVIDTLGNVTFGTVGRVGHTFTGLVDGFIDILTMGYASKR